MVNTPREIPVAVVIPEQLQEQLGRLHAMVQVLTDLDRCPHGRHEGDSCAGYRPGEPMSGCEGGISVGNPLTPTGVRIGSGRDGHPIWMPPRGHRHEAAAWRRPWKPDGDGLKDVAAAYALGETEQVVGLRRAMGISYHRVGNNVYGYGVQVWSGDTLVGLQPVDGGLHRTGPYQVLVNERDDTTGAQHA